MLMKLGPRYRVDRHVAGRVMAHFLEHDRTALHACLVNAVYVVHYRLSETTPALIATAIRQFAQNAAESDLG
jgi:hypothetical protein